MRVRFEELYWKASRGELFSWRTSAQGRLAEILLLDQIPRNIFRGTAQAFMTDSLALVLAQEGLTQAQELPVVQRGFFYMPFMHSDSSTIWALSTSECHLRTAFDQGRRGVFERTFWLLREDEAHRFQNSFLSS